MKSQLEMNHQKLKEIFGNENRLVSKDEVDEIVIDGIGNELWGYRGNEILVPIRNGNGTLLGFELKKENIMEMEMKTKNGNEFQNENGNETTIGNGNENGIGFENGNENEHESLWKQFQESFLPQILK